MYMAEIDNRFSYHKPDEQACAKIQAIRDGLKEVAHFLNDSLPEGREKSLAVTHLEETMFWSSAAIARAFSIAARNETTTENVTMKLVEGTKIPEPRKPVD